MARSGRTAGLVFTNSRCILIASSVGARASWRRPNSFKTIPRVIREAPRALCKTWLGKTWLVFASSRKTFKPSSVGARASCHRPSAASRSPRRSSAPARNSSLAGRLASNQATTCFCSRRAVAVSPFAAAASAAAAQPCTSAGIPLPAAAGAWASSTPGERSGPFTAACIGTAGSDGGNTRALSSSQRRR